MTFNEVVVAEDGGNPIATGVQKIKFDFGAGQFGWSAFGEIDVIAVPEPSIAGLGLLGLGGMLLGWRA